jgi:hypothetical protein
VAAVAYAGAFTYKGSSLTWTEPSGTNGAQHADLVTTAEYYGLRSMKLTEYGHRACVLDLEQSAFATGDLSRLDSLRICEPTVGTAWKGADVGSGKFVTALAVCTGKEKSDSRIFGVELFSSSIQPDGKLVPSKASVKLEFPECKKWHPKVSCPADAVATGLRGTFDDADHGMVGIALRCHELEPHGK